MLRGALSNARIVNQYLQSGLQSIWNPFFFPGEKEGAGLRKGAFATCSLRLEASSLVPMPVGNIDSWCRQIGLSILFGESSPLAIIVVDPAGGLKRRLIISREGFPLTVNDPGNLWSLSGRRLDQLLPKALSNWLGDSADSLFQGHLEVAFSSSLKRLFDVYAARHPTTRARAARRETVSWQLQPVRNQRSSRPVAASTTTLAARDGDTPVTGWELTHSGGPWRHSINLGATGMKKQIRLDEITQSWDQLFDVTTGRIHEWTKRFTDHSGDFSSILPSALLPLTSLVIGNHAHRGRPVWILWLFYDPVKNQYFRRLVDCSLSPLGVPASAALRLIYLWPESSPHLAQLVDRPIPWFDEHILNLSDILRDRLVDYELITVDDLGPHSGIAADRFPVAPVFEPQRDGEPNPLVTRAEGIIDAIKNADFSEEELDLLGSIPFDSAVNHPDAVRTYHKFAGCVEAMDACLLRAGEATSSKLAKALYSRLPKGLKQAIRDGLRQQHVEHLEERTVNYFIFLGALRLLGANYYYVGQSLVHNMVPGVPKGSQVSDWRMAPSGFIVASTVPMTEDFIADLRLVYSTVMAPIVEQYAKWISDYEPNRAQVKRNFPCLHRVPRHYLTSLNRRFLTPDIEWLSGTDRDSLAPYLPHSKFTTDLDWVRRLPKADIHVHLGPAIPIDVLYDLSLLSLSVKWKWTLKSSFSPEQKTLIGKTKELVTKSIERLRDKEAAGESVDPVTTEAFGEALFEIGSEQLGVDVIDSINGLIDALAHACPVEGKSDKNLTACVFNTVLGLLIRPKLSEWQTSLDRRIGTLKSFRDYIGRVRKALDDDEAEVKGAGRILLEARRVVGRAYVVPNDSFIQSICRRVDAVKLSALLDLVSRIDEEQPCRDAWKPGWGDPLSCVMSMPRRLSRKTITLDRYISAMDLTGSSVLQSYETLILGVIETIEHACRTDSVRYMELKLSPRGLVTGRIANEGEVIATALLASASLTDRAVEALGNARKFFWLDESRAPGAEALRRPPYVLGNVIIAGKRLDSREYLKATVRHAVDARESYLAALRELPGDSRAESESGLDGRIDEEWSAFDVLERGGLGLIVPRVVGVDLVGKERGVRHAELRESLTEAFEKCILVTIHAGEDEEERSIWEAIFELHAQRIGHGVRLSGGANLAGLIRDRRIPIELCPISNHFTNGFYLDEKPYVYEDYAKRRLTVTISTDDPWVSHRLKGPADSGAPYPLSDEFLSLPLLFRPPKGVGSRIGALSRLEVLHLIYNSFDNAFLPAPDRDAIIALVDLEAFLVIRATELKYQVVELREAGPRDGKQI
jgi:adenosine deaminase